MHRSLAAITLLVLAGVALPAQQAPTGNATVDSADAARTAFRQAEAALRRGDLTEARRLVRRAATAWPNQPDYVWSSATLAARAADTAGVIEALQAFADLGLGRDLADFPRLAPLRGLPAVADLARRLDANVAPIVASRQLAVVPDTTFYPEGMDVDPRSGHVFVASIRHATIAELDDRGMLLRELPARHSPGVWSVLGVRVDPARGRLWATTTALPQGDGYRAADSGHAALLQIRLSDGTIERRWDLPPSTHGHVLGDLAIGPNGDIFVTDSFEPVLYRLRPGADTLERFTHPLFRSLQGVVPSADGQALYVADYSHGILRVDFDNRTATRLTDAPGSTSIGCDGIAWYQGSIVAVQNGVTPARIMRFHLDAPGVQIVRATVIDRNWRVADEPTIGAILGDEFLYVANSQWNKFEDDGSRRRDTRLAPAVILALPLAR